MNKSTYSQLLRDPRWQRKRLEIMQRDGWRCTKCCDDKTELNVHHKEYRKGRKPWEYSDDILVTLCKPCHEAEHAPEPPRPSWEKDFEGPIVGAVIPWGDFSEEGFKPGSPIGWSGKMIDYPNSERNSVYICCDGSGREFLVDAGSARGFLFPKNTPICQSVFFVNWINPFTTPKATVDWIKLIQKMTDEGTPEVET